MLYNAENAPTWASESSGSDVDRLVLQSDRNLVLLGTDGSTVWQSNTAVAAASAPEAAPAPEAVPAPPAPEAPPAPRTYTVESGDTLWAIAERFYGDGNRYQEIAAASGIANPDAIGVGQVVTIP